MKKIELLAPVGNMEMLYQAVHHGADAVYLGGKDFGARKYSENFTNEELREVVRYAHLYDVKVYITVNTIVYEKEVESFLEYVSDLYAIHVDALIMQDLGMIALVREMFPDFCIHASTQMHNHNQEGARFLEKLGVSRVVLARELSLQEIGAIATPLEKEVFIHGALCVSYSGNCLFSSLIGGRSGNRGMCAGSCRLPYHLLEEEKRLKTEGEYLLSTKEFSSIAYLKEILASGIDSLKIEGRMKSAAYVGLVTSIYRKLIDKYYNHEELSFSEEEVHDLKKIFNRGFTKGFLNGADNKDLMNIQTPNHIGVGLGQVVEFDKKKIKIKLKEPLYQKDGIRFVDQGQGFLVNYLYDEKNRLIDHANDFVYLDNTIGINSYTQVLKTFDSRLKERLNHYEKKRIPIAFKVVAKAQEGVQILITDFHHAFTSTIFSIDKAQKKATTKEEVQEKLLKIQDTPFYCKKIDFDMDKDLFIPMSLINRIRRSLVEQLLQSRYQDFREVKKQPLSMKSSHKPLTHEISIIVRNEEQLKVCLQEACDHIYVDDYALYLKYKSMSRVYYYLDRVNPKYVPYEKDHLLVSDLGALQKYSGFIMTSCYLNVVNSYTLNALLQYAYKVTLSVENDVESLKAMLTAYQNRYGYFANVDVIVYGKVDLMIMKYCPLNLLVNKEKTCCVCKNHKKYYLEDRKNEKYRILQKREITHIVHSKNIDLLDKIQWFKKQNITNYTILLLDETEEEIKNILKKVI